MRNKPKHSKVRNTGLLYEFLLRQITADVLNKSGTSKAVNIVKQKFNENTELGRELALYNILIGKKFTSDRKADFFINEVLTQRKSLNKSALRREKYNLIKQLKETYDLQKFLSSKVPNYKLYASIYKLFEHRDLSPDEKTESHFNIVEHVTTIDKNVKLSENITLPDDEELRIIAYRTLLERFNSKYTKLSSTQKKLLKEYINNVSNTSSLKDTLREIVTNLKKDLKTHSKTLKDKVVKIKMNEVLKTMDKFCGLSDNSKSVKDSYVLQTMRYLELLKELKRSGSKNKKVI